MGTAGMPDILFVDYEHLEGIEVKRDTKQKLNPNQVSMVCKFRDHHVNYHVTCDPNFDIFKHRVEESEFPGLCLCWSDWE